MKQWINRITWALLFYFIFLIVTLPAYLLVSRIPLDKSIELGNVTGTVWSGSVDAIRIDQTIIKDVSWTVDFTQLIAAKIAVDLEFGNPRKILEPQGKAQLQYGLNGPSVRDLRVKLPADLIVQQVDMPFKAEASGLVEANIAEARLGQPVCHTLDGQVNWKLAAVTYMDTNYTYGDVKASLSCDENGALVSKITGNPELLTLDIDAKLTTYQNYSIEGFISPGSNASKQMRSALSFLGNTDNQGRYYIKFTQ